MELIYIFLTVWRNKGTYVHLERCLPDVWYWWWLLILLDFADVLYFLAVDYKVKEGENIYD